MDPTNPDPRFDVSLTPVTGPLPPLPLTAAQREQIFGSFIWQPTPAPDNPERITIVGDWVAKHIVTVSLPQLAHLGAHSARFHSLGADQLQGLFAAWESAGLLPKILSWDGSFVARKKRGNKGNTPSDLSNHAWGTAFDINARWNSLGQTPRALGTLGSVRELVSLARHFGFFWGGDFHSRLDGMHFELCRVLPSVT